MHRRRFFTAASAVAAFAPGLAQAQDTTTGLSEYTGRVLTVSEMLVWFFNEETRLTESADQSSFLDQDWQIDVLAPFSIPKAAQTVLDETDVPALMEEVHGHLAESVGYLVDAEPFMRDGILNVNPDSVALAAELVGLAGEAIDKATAAMPTLRGARVVPQLSGWPDANLGRNLARSLARMTAAVI